jgi:2-amino-4-hydroxy-6-hydroxymethyldihydropteridine diphosphokinase
MKLTSASSPCERPSMRSICRDFLDDASSEVAGIDPPHFFGKSARGDTRHGLGSLALNAVIGLGSNLGERRALLLAAARAVHMLGKPGPVSALYETVPVGPPQPLFLNAALAIETPLAPDSLLDALLEIERQLGRVRRERWGPRSIDLDILWIAEGPFESPRLSVPHPELRCRAFALRPLLDVAPGATDPRDGTPYTLALALLEGDPPLEIAGTRLGWT